MTETQTTPDIDRAGAYRALVALLGTLPAPLDISFARRYPAMVKIKVDSPKDVTAWATALGVNSWISRGSIHGDTEQWSVHGPWQGYDLWIDCILRIEAPSCDCDCSKAGA